MAGATLAMPRLLLAAAGKCDKFGGDLSSVRAAIDKQRPEAIKRLQDWIALPSIAAENRNMQEGVRMMIDLLKDAGFQSAKVMPTDGQPGVFATLDAGAARTVGMYFMYDVKQFDPKEWSSSPLEGAIVDKAPFGKVMIGRGATNQKGPEATFLAALHALKAAGRKPPVNIVLVAEGEEEIASPHFSQVVHQPEVLKALSKCHEVFMPSPRTAARLGQIAPAPRARLKWNGGLHRAVGPRIEGRHPFELLNPTAPFGAWSRRSDPGIRGRQRPGHRWMVRACQTPDHAPERADR